MRVRSFVHWCGGVLLLTVSLAQAGCGGGDVEPLEAFEARWHERVNARNGAGLYGMLDGNSQRKLEHDLQTLRGLPADQQAMVIDQLGGKRVSSLSELQTDEYFGMLWNRATHDERPRMAIEAAGPANAYMILTMNDGSQERIQLIAQGGKWRWRLPEQNFAQPPNVDRSADDAPEEADVADEEEARD